jgi:hypothetical protein
MPSTAPSQYSFVRWSDGGALTHSIVVPTTGLTVAATYALQHKLSSSVATPVTGTLAVSPVSSNLFYSQGSMVNLNATPMTGYCFSAWTGLAAGTPNQTAVTMTRSLSPVATFIPGAITPSITSATVPAAGGTFTMNTTATTGCGWIVKSSAAWLKVSKAYATSAAPTFTYTLQPNTSGLVRTATITIGSKPVTITQSR